MSFVRDSKKTSLREIKEEMGPSFSSNLKDHNLIGYWGNTAVYVGIVNGLSRSKHFQKNSETTGLVLVPLNQDMEVGSHIAVLDKNGTGVVNVNKSNFSSFVLQRLSNDFAKGLNDVLSGNLPNFSGCLSTSGQNKGAANMVLTNYKDRVNNITVPCLYLVKENRFHKYSNKINFCAGKWEFNDGHINGRNPPFAQKTSSKTNPSNRKKFKNVKGRNPYCGVMGCISCKQGQRHRCPDCGGNDHRGAAHWNKGQKTYQRGHCRVMGCISCKHGQRHYCKVCKSYATHRACEHF
jgi:hypothetical protein